MKALACALLLSLAAPIAAQEPEDELDAPVAVNEPNKKSHAAAEAIIGIVAINLFFNGGAALASLVWGGQWYVWRTIPSRPSNSPAPEGTQSQ